MKNNYYLCKVLMKCSNMNNSRRRRITNLVVYAVFIFIGSAQYVSAQTAKEQAKYVFKKTFDKVFGPEGSTFSYNVNIIGLYKNAGTMWTKGKNYKFAEERYMGWTKDGVYHKVDKKKKVVEIHKASSPNRDKYSGQIQFDEDDFDYKVKSDGKNYIISMDIKKNAKGKSTIKHTKIVVDKKNMNPQSLKVKILFFWAAVDITNFKAGITDESIFNFPKDKYADYKFDDQRDKE